jgi:hypothetical protein
MQDPYLDQKLMTKIGSGGSGSKKIIRIHNTGGNNKKKQKAMNVNVTKEKGEGRHQVYLGHAALMAGVQAQLQAVGKQSSLKILQNLLT